MKVHLHRLEELEYLLALGDPANANDPTGMFSEDDDDFEEEEQNPQALAGGATLGDRTDGVSCDADGTNCYSSVTVSGDEDGSGDGVTFGVNVAAPGLGDPTTPISGGPYNSCVGGSMGVGTAIGAGVGGGVLGGTGLLIGGAIGTFLGPGGTFIFGAWGIEVGSTSGVLAGGSLGAYLGGIAGSILCSKGAGGKGERGWAAKPDGTDNPNKKLRWDPIKKRW